MPDYAEKIDRLKKELERTETYHGEHKVIRRSIAKASRRVKALAVKKAKEGK